MEGLHLTNVLADLNGLRTVKEQAAEQLLTVKSIPASPTGFAPAIGLPPTTEISAAPAQQQQPQQQQTLQPPQQNQRHHTRTGSASGLLSRGASPAIFDKANTRRLFTPPLSRNSSHQGSVPGTPRHMGEAEEPSLVLQELRKRLQNQELADLKRMRDAIAAMHAKQQHDGAHHHNTDAVPELKRKSFSYTGSPTRSSPPL
jgi:hypothetical protein